MPAAAACRKALLFAQQRQHKARALAEALPPWMLGMAVATPVVAVGQGALLLQDYRNNHGDAPRPDMPSRGVVIARKDGGVVTGAGREGEEGGNGGGAGASSSSSAASALLRNRWASGGGGSRKRPRRDDMHHRQPPLRLLVIGDSLAAGVGMAESSVPALPESIAQALSKANDGRAVYWTCVGTPGNSSVEIVQQIYHLEETPSEPPLIVRRLAEWWQEQRRSAAKSRRNLDPRERIQTFRSQAREWWELHQQPVQLPEGEEEKLKKNPVGRWWKRSRLAAERDWVNLRRIAATKQQQRDGADSDDEEGNERDRRNLEQKVTTMVQRNRLEPSFMNQYDIAVVLTGLNDLKDSFLPFMMSEQRARKLRNLQQQEGSGGDVGGSISASSRDDGGGSGESAPSGLKGQLLRVIQALKSKMRIPSLPGDATAGTTDTSDEKATNERSGKESAAARWPAGTATCTPSCHPVAAASTRTKNSRFGHRDRPIDRHQPQGPLVVFPALPVEPIKVAAIAPLSWFLVPLIRGMDRKKQEFASAYPDLVLYVDSPGLRVFEDVEAKRGALWHDFHQGDRGVLLKLDSIAHHVRHRVEDLMRKHYASWVLDADDDRSAASNNASEDDLYMLEADDVLPLADQFHGRRPGSTMVSPDGIHPNDRGYEIWGRYIAQAIMEHWDQRSEMAWRVERRRWRGVLESSL